MKKSNLNTATRIRPMKHFFGILATFVAWILICLIIFLVDIIKQTNYFMDYKFFLFTAAMIFIVLAMFYIFIVFTRPRIVIHTKYIVLINVMFVVCVALNYFFSTILNEYVRPFAIIALLTTILLGKRVGILSNICFAMIMLFVDIYDCQGIVTIATFAPLTINIFVGTLFVFLTNKDAKRMRGILVGVYMVPAVIVISFVMELLAGKPIVDALKIMGWSALSPLLSSVLFMALLPIIEYSFNVTTNFRLIELVDHNNELLKEMQRVAPGTYNHSYMVSNLAESCAYAIGENTHLVRAAAYYHDIGKMVNPEYFTENQSDGVNPHDKLLPEISVSFLKKHVSYGIKLARKYKLPEEIVNVIAEHHGTMLIKFFYYKALNYTDGELPIDDFTYDGPKPQSKVSAIIMIVDACEAALRSVDKKDIDKVRGIVDSVVQERMDFNQFDECDITLRELNVIKQTIVSSVIGLYHQRIGYPDIKITRHGIEAH